MYGTSRKMQRVVNPKSHSTPLNQTRNPNPRMTKREEESREEAKTAKSQLILRALRFFA
jgi:hypothetical protein